MSATLSTTIETGGKEGAVEPARWPSAHFLVPAAAFLALTLLRTRGVSRTFWLLGDQILYWKIALGPWRDLPIGGGPSSVGGTTLGPIFCWVLWAIRHLIGPWCDNLPHAGGIGLSMLQSAADALLLAALWTRAGSVALALAFALFIATAPFDMALSATIWNPPLAVAFVKTSMAFVLLGGSDSSVKWDAAATAAAVLALQAHSSAVFFAAPVIASFVARPLIARQWRDAGRRAAVLSAVILLFESPFLADLATHTGRSTSPAVVVRTVSYTLSHPGALRPAASFRAVVSGCQHILFWPWTLPWAGAIFGVCLVLAAVRARRDLTLAAASIAPPLCAIVGFAFWQFPYDDYWFMTIVPSVALAAVLAVTMWRRAAPVIAVVLLVTVCVALPSRVAGADRLFRLPEYAALSEGSRQIRRRMPEIQRLDTAFTLPASTDPLFLYRILGGRVAPDAPFAATIRADGSVVFDEVASGKGH